MKISEALHTTADNLERDGWMNPHIWTEGSAPTCAQVAIGRVVGIDQREDVEGALLAHIGGTYVTDIWAWNDAEERTAREVIEALRAAAVIEAAKETAERPRAGVGMIPTRRLLDGPRIPAPRPTGGRAR